MIKITSTLITIRLRKFLPAKDIVALALFLVAYIALFVGINERFTTFKNYILLLVIEIWLYHLNRKDLELLRCRKDFKVILFLEYLIYGLPCLLLFLWNKEWILFALFFLLLIVTLWLPQKNNKVFSYPFKHFDPFWFVTFRKNKLILFYILALFLIVISHFYKNENLLFVALFLIGLIATIPTFNKESVTEIKISDFTAKNYLFQQFKNSFYNTFLLVIPVIVIFVIGRKMQYLHFVPLLLVLPILGLLFKYTFFGNLFLHQLFFMLFVGNLPFGFPLLLVPVLYYKSLKTLENIKNATN